MYKSATLLFVGIPLLFATVLGIPLINTDTNMEYIPVPVDKYAVSLIVSPDGNKRQRREVGEETDDDEEEGDDVDATEKADDYNEKQENNPPKVQKQLQFVKSKPESRQLLDGHDDDIELGENTLEDLRELDKFYISAKAQILGLHKYRISSIPGEAEAKDTEVDDNKAIEMD